MLIFTAAIALLWVPHVFADTAANTRIINSVIVQYSDALGGNPTTSAPVSVTVTVLLVQAAPTLTVTTSNITTAYSGVPYTLDYVISSNANGDDNYAVEMSESVASPNLDDPGFTYPGGTVISLGGTTLAANVLAGANTITVPYDATGAVNLVNGIATTEWIVIDGDTLNPRQVQSISHDSVANTTSIVIAGTIAANASAGVVVGEYRTFQVEVTTGALTSGTSGDYTLRTTATSSASGPSADQSPADSLITVRLLSLNVSKYVRNTNPANTSGSGPYPYDGNTYYSADVNGVPTDVLEYIIVVENPAGASLATNVIIEDTIPQFTTIVDPSMLLDGSSIDQTVNGDAGRYDTATRTIYIYAGDTPGTDDGTGGTLSQGQTTIGQFQVTIN